MTNFNLKSKGKMIKFKPDKLKMSKIQTEEDKKIRKLNWS